LHHWQQSNARRKLWLVKHALLLGAVLSWVVGCHNKQAEGPMERAGKHVDHAAKKTGEAAKKAVHATGEAFEKTGKKLKGNDAPASASKPAQ
jgi:hypothetical protein